MLKVGGTDELAVLDCDYTNDTREQDDLILSPGSFL